MKKHIFVILVLAVLAGCSRDASTTNSNSAFIDVSNPKELPSSEIIESVDFLFLNETDDIMIGDVSDLCYVDELWYILDISAEPPTFQFSFVGETAEAKAKEIAALQLETCVSRPNSSSTNAVQSSPSLEIVPTCRRLSS